MQVEGGALAAAAAHQAVLQQMHAAAVAAAKDQVRVLGFTASAELYTVC